MKIDTLADYAFGSFLAVFHRHRRQNVSGVNKQEVSVHLPQESDLQQSLSAT